VNSSIKAPIAFHATWTDRFWTSKRVYQDQVAEWHAQLMDQAGHNNWTRMIVNNWQSNGITTAHQVLQIAKWLADAADPQVFITRRGRSAASFGAQIWCQTSDVQLLVHMMAAPVLQVKMFTPEQFSDHTLTMLNWMMPP
jgi:hypothetical protein